MAVKVRQETIDRISKMGLARSLAEAQKGDPEMQEAVRRYYPNAKFGANSQATAKQLQANDRAATQSVRKSGDRVPNGGLITSQNQGTSLKAPVSTVPVKKAVVPVAIKNAAARKVVQMDKISNKGKAYKSTANKSSTAGEWLFKKIGDKFSSNNKGKVKTPDYGKRQLSAYKSLGYTNEQAKKAVKKGIK